VLVGTGWSKQPWQVNFLKEQILLPSWINDEIMKLLKRWAEVYYVSLPKEDTFASINFNIPSMLVRVDFTVTEEDKKVWCYEIEDSPAGLGVWLKLLAPQELSRRIMEELSWLGEVTVIWPSKEREKGGDDPLLWPTIAIDELESKIEEIKLVAPRVNALPPEVTKLSIWPVKNREKKAYLVPMGLAEELDKSVNLEKLWNTISKHFEGMVLKSDGSQSKMVLILPTKRLTKKVYNWLGTSNFGVWKLGTIQEKIKNWERVYIQPFFWPIPIELNSQHYFGIFRIFYAYNPNENEWLCLGGFLNGRDSLLIHGATDSVLISVMPPWYARVFSNYSMLKLF
jgi:hypothetical protein